MIDVAQAGPAVSVGSAVVLTTLVVGAFVAGFYGILLGLKCKTCGAWGLNITSLILLLLAANPSAIGQPVVALAWCLYLVELIITSILTCCRNNNNKKSCNKCTPQNPCNECKKNNDCCGDCCGSSCCGSSCGGCDSGCCDSDCGGCGCNGCCGSDDKSKHCPHHKCPPVKCPPQCPNNPQYRVQYEPQRFYGQGGYGSASSSSSFYSN